MKTDSFWYQVTVNSAKHSSKQFIVMNSLILIINIIGIIYYDHHFTDEDTETYRGVQDIKLVCIVLILITSSLGARIYAFAVTLHCLERVKVINVLREDVATGSVAIHLSFVRKVAKSVMGRK